MTTKPPSRKHFKSGRKLSSSFRIAYYLCSLLTIILTKHDLPTVHGSIGECNYELHKFGCSTQANLQCDVETKRCKCRPETPILVSQSYCLKKAKPNEICEYYKQCDSENGFFCLYDSSSQQYECSSTVELAEQLAIPDIKCRCSRPLTLKLPDNFLERGQLQPPHLRSNHDNKQSSSPTPTTNTAKPRWVWMILILSLLLLVALLFMIKFQSLRRDRSFHHAEDRHSINSEQDVPPPYEVAIRMKL